MREYRAVSYVQPDILNKNGYYIFGPAKSTRDEAIAYRDPRQQETWSVLDSVLFREVTSWMEDDE